MDGVPELFAPSSFLGTKTVRLTSRDLHMGRSGCLVGSERVVALGEG
jgi:hypothetical protein